MANYQSDWEIITSYNSIGDDYRNYLTGLSQEERIYWVDVMRFSEEGVDAAITGLEAQYYRDMEEMEA